jgi:hypothetical protein
MKARSRERTTENAALTGRGRMLSVAAGAKTVPPNLAGIYQKGRKPGVSGHPSRPTFLMCDSRSTTIDKGYLSRVRCAANNRTM